MKTLSDIFDLGEAAANAGEPLVINWPQMRSSLLLFGRAGGTLDQVRTATFDSQFPEDFEDLGPAEQAVFPTARVYNLGRKDLSRMLAMLGQIDDPWEQLRMMIRNAGRPDIEGPLAGLSTPAKEAGLVPADIRSEWVWSLNAERGVLTDDQMERRRQRERRRGKPPAAKLHLSVRHRLRRGVAVFNTLFDIPEIAASGLLPPEPIGSPPDYDRQGRRLYHLPPTLARYEAGALDAPQGGMRQVWQAICVSGAFDMPEDPGADDLLNPDVWSLISQLSGSITGVSDITWKQYVDRTRRMLLPHVTLPVPERLPERFEVLMSYKQDRWPIQTLWQLVCENDMTDVDLDDLLHLETWRGLWSNVSHSMKPNTWWTWEARARKLLVAHTGQADPYRLTTRIWADLPAHTKVALDPIRKTAERAMMRPLDLSPDWVERQGLTIEQKADIIEALREVFFAAAQVRIAAPPPNPVALGWEALRTAARAQDLSSQNFIVVKEAATHDGIGPNELSRRWAVDTAALMDSPLRCRFAAALRDLDRWLEDPVIASLLHSKPIGALPDARKRGKIDPPESIFQELDQLHGAYDRAPSTRREGRSIVRTLWTAAVGAGTPATSLNDLLRLEPEMVDLDKRTRQKASRLLQDALSVDAQYI